MQMDIYLDFEATQFKENIIAIGAHCINGDFDCLTRPPRDDKLTNFITQLTGITQEMLEDAPAAEEAFYDLYQWLAAVSEGPTFFHVYGDMDKIFLQNTAKYIDNPGIKQFVLNLANSVIDDSISVRHFFHSSSIGLYRALRYFIPDLDEQDHDPLNDAIVLALLMERIKVSNPPEGCSCAEQPKKLKNTTTTKPSYTISVIHTTEPNAKPQMFSNYGDAINWIHKIISKRCPDVKKGNIAKRVKRAIDTNSIYMNRQWSKTMIN